MKYDRDPNKSNKVLTHAMYDVDESRTQYTKGKKVDVYAMIPFIGNVQKR